MLYIIFICTAVPISLMLSLLEKKSRTTLFYMLLGLIICLLAAQINFILRDSFYGTWDPNVFAVTTTLTPIVEELLKAIPIIYFGFVISDKRADLLTVSMALGIGFAILENCYILVANLDQTSIIWAFTRGFSSALLHGICTSLIGFGVSYVKKRKKLFYTGTFALLTVAIIVHGLFNAFIQSRYAYIGVILPIAIYIPFVIIPFVKQKTPPKVK
jgi:RsiW-degrading membrane proteinase PrsW (M82 family)